MYVKIENMEPGDTFLSNRSGWLTVLDWPRRTLRGVEVRVQRENGSEMPGFCAPGIYTVTRRKHRRDCGQDWIPLAKCSEGSTGGGGCANGMCPRHSPTGYADHMARHATDTIPHLSLV